MLPGFKVIAPRVRAVIKERLHELWHMPTEPVEVYIGTMFAGLGVVLITATVLGLPTETTFFSNNPVWRAAYTLMPNEIVAGLIFLAIGVTKFAGVLTKNCQIRRTASMAATVMFLFIVGSFVSNSLFSTWWLFMSGAFLSAWVFLRLGRPW